MDRSTWLGATLARGQRFYAPLLRLRSICRQALR
jgi:hypothetical protein